MLANGQSEAGNSQTGKAKRALTRRAGKAAKRTKRAVNLN